MHGFQTDASSVWNQDKLYHLAVTKDASFDVLEQFV